LSHDVRLKKESMYTDSDNDERDSSLSLPAGGIGRGAAQGARGGHAPAIEPNSQFDRQIRMSSDDDDGDFDIKPAAQAAAKRPAAAAAKPAPSGKAARPSAPPRYDDDLDAGAPAGAADDAISGAAGMASLFALIGKFHPEPVEIPVHWKPFIPDLVPAIGSIDAFIKVPRPDGDLDDLGLVIVDEPSIAQSNPQVLRMELREQYGVTSPSTESDGYVGHIEDLQKNRKALDSWLDSLEEIHRNRPPPTIIYTHKMPEMEDLMEPWPAQLEEALASVLLPTADIDLGFDEFARVICALLEIPVRGNLIESIHHLFTLYSSFTRNDYFAAGAD
jgi:intraflagellar transport protein 46